MNCASFKEQTTFLDLMNTIAVHCTYDSRIDEHKIHLQVLHHKMHNLGCSHCLEAIVDNFVPHTRKKRRLVNLVKIFIQFIFSGNIHWGGDKCAHSRFFLLYSGDILGFNLIRGNVSIMFSLPRGVSGPWYSTPPLCPASLCFLTEALDPRLVRPRSSLWPRPEKQEYFCSKNTSSPEITSSSVQYNEIQPPINLSPMPIQPN